MRFASLGSGSRGNAMVVEAGNTKVLLDCGFGPRELKSRLSRLGLVIDDFAAILVTHEHSDHSAGVFKCARRHQLKIYMTHGTLAAASDAEATLASLCLIDTHQTFSVGDLEIHPYPVPHDAREPVQFVFSDGRHRLGVLTDTGCITPHIFTMLSVCDALVLECNHDLGMLDNSAYPWPLKQRIRGRYGHLDNQTSADLLAGLDHSRLQHVIAAHLSEQNNTPQRARAALASAIGCDAEWVGVATQDDGLAWRELI
ncbi:MAG: MBL fold metallo-hydrolase [Betaproteobacteria bacterium]|nr:MBL fold metallo-hydrolase [Betaproteobacteria bacterium]